LLGGVSGTGKSSLVNALCGRLETDSEAAEVGSEGEITQDIKGYKHKSLPRVVFWDTPGGGICQHSAHSYIRDMSLFAFDALIVVTGGRLL